MSGSCDEIDEPIARVLMLLGKRWTGMVMHALLEGPANFSDLRRSVTGISDRVLNERLTELLAFNLVSRRVIEGPPLRVQYALTDHGLAIRAPLTSLGEWAATHLTIDTIRPAVAPCPPSDCAPCEDVDLAAGDLRIDVL